MAGAEPTVPDEAGDTTESAYPAKIDRYRVDGILGRGGMGVVLAAHDPDLSRDVAIKLVATSGSPAAQARLLREARAVAQLSHPNIIAVHDVGVISDRVWVAMERVSGDDLEAWLARPRSLAAVVDVFMQAGRGLSAAHTAGIVHRDFKPANVLVGTSRVKVADFGLARFEAGADGSMAGNASAADVASHTGLVGTPAYMAPEQLAGEPITSAADQFSFCVALYRAVVGALPFAGDDVSARLEAMSTERALVFPRRAPGWLRAVLDRGLRRDPTARFPSMDALLDALDRGRHRRQRVVAFAAAITVIGGGVLAWSLMRNEATPCRGLEHHVAGVWNDTRRVGLRAALGAKAPGYGAALAASVVGELDRYTDGWTRMRIGVCEATRVRGEQSESLLDARNLCLDRRLEALNAAVTLLSSPTEAKVVAEALGTVQRLPALDECADVERLGMVRPPSTDPGIRERIAAVERELARARALADASDSRRALPIAQAAVKDAEAIGYAPLFGAALLVVGNLERETGAIESAERSLDRALDIAVETRDAALEAEVSVAFVELRALGQKQAREAIALERPTEAALTRAGRPPGPRIALLRALAMAHRIDGNYEQQRKTLEEALALAQTTYGPDHVTTLDALCRVAHSLDDLREREQALALVERCLAGRKRTLGERHPAVGRGLHTLGVVQNGLLRRADAEATYKQAIAILEETLGKDDPMLANVYADMSTSQRRQKKLAEALASAEHALAIDRKTYGTSHVNVGLSLVSTGHLKRDLERYEDALAAYREANELFAKLLDAEHPYIGTTYGSMGETYEYMKRFDDAITMQERALAIQTKRPEHCAQPFIARVTLAEPIVLRARPGDRARALALLREARDGLTACGPKAEPELKKLAHMLASHRLTL